MVCVYDLCCCSWLTDWYAPRFQFSSVMWPSLTWDSRLAYVLSPCCRTLMVSCSYLNVSQRGMDDIDPSRCFVSRRVTGSNGWLPFTGGGWRKSAKQTTLIPRMAVCCTLFQSSGGVCIEVLMMKPSKVHQRSVTSDSLVCTGSWSHIWCQKCNFSC